MKKGILVEKLVELLEDEHPGCDDNTCLINAEMLEQYPVHIGECFASSGAASKQFEQTLKKLTKRYKSPFQRSSLEARKICASIEHMQCSCNAVIWNQEGWYSEGDAVQCASCGVVNTFKGESNE